MNQTSAAVAIIALSCGQAVAAERAPAPILKTERFDRNPGWEGVNNRRGLERGIKQDFGHSASAHAGGSVGEAGGFITPAAEPAYYAKVTYTAASVEKAPK